VDQGLGHPAGKELIPHNYNGCLAQADASGFLHLKVEDVGDSMHLKKTGGLHSIPWGKKGIISPRSKKKRSRDYSSGCQMVTVEIGAE